MATDTNISAATITASRAAHAAGIGLRRLHGITHFADAWLMGDGKRSAGAWRRFAPVDVLRIAVVARILDYGFTLAEAREALDASVDRWLGGIAAYRDLPVSFMVQRVRGLVVGVVRDNGRIVVTLEAPDGRSSNAHSYDTALTLNIGRIAEAVAGRLSAAATTPGRSRDATRGAGGQRKPPQ